MRPAKCSGRFTDFRLVTQIAEVGYEYYRSGWRDQIFLYWNAACRCRTRHRSGSAARRTAGDCWTLGLWKEHTTKSAWCNRDADERSCAVGRRRHGDARRYTADAAAATPHWLHLPGVQLVADPNGDRKRCTTFRA